MECLLEEKPIELKNIELDICKCGRYCFKGSWGEGMGREIPRIVRENLVVPMGIEIMDMGVKHEIKGDRVLVRAEIHGIYNEKEFRKSLEFQILLKRVSCPICSRIKGDYYEAILQFRTKYRPTLKDINPEMISRIEEVRGGVDFYLVDGKYAHQIKRKFKERGFYVKESSKLIGRKQGKTTCRVSVSIKEPDFSEGDFLIHKNRILRILERGSKTRLLDIVAGKRSTLPLQDLEDSEIVARGSDARKGIVIAITPDDVQIMDLQSNRIYSTANRPQGIENGQEVEIINIRDRMYIVP